MPAFVYARCAALLGGLALFLAACDGRQPPAATSPAAPASVAPAPPGPDYRLATEQRLGDTDFYLTLPTGFRVKSTNAADFLVYYFAPADTTVRADFTGGLYFGSQPQGDVTDTTSGCRTRRATMLLLGRPTPVTIHRCATGYTVSSVFASRSGRGWDAQVDAFGEAESAAGLRQLLAVLATLRRQPTSSSPNPSSR